MDLFIKNAKVIDPFSGLDEETNIGIKEGKLSYIGHETLDAEREIDGAGLCLSPGFIDLHVHLRDPGQTEKEDIISGALAAAAGGFTSIFCMPNTKPSCDSVETVSYIKEKARNAACEIYPVGAMTKGLKGLELCDFLAYKEAGVLAVSDDGFSVEDPQMMRRAVEGAKKAGLLPMCHSDDIRLVCGGVINEGEISKKLGLPGNPKLSEEVTVARDLLIAEHLGTRVHICHVSSKTSVRLIREAKARGVIATCETAPHYFSLDERAVLEREANAKMNPPLRTAEDVNAIIEGIKDGTIDCIATDHAPHTVEEKSKDLKNAPFGIVGLETSFGVSYTRLVRGGHISLAELIRLMSLNPAQIAELDRGKIEVGETANLCIFSEDEAWTVDKNKFISKGRNTPFDGDKLFGRVKYTILSGKIVFEDGKGN